MDELFNAVMLAGAMGRERGDEVFTWVRAVIDVWPEESEHRKNAEELHQRALDRKDGKAFEGDIQTTPLQIHSNILTSAGIDPTTEPWATLIALAIKDDDPTRVLQSCRHKTVLPHWNRDLRLDRLSLERANLKIIACQLHRHAVGGRALDEIDEQFNGQHCTGCADKAPHPAGWSCFEEPSV
jgi:hypothetical protein